MVTRLELAKVIAVRTLDVKDTTQLQKAVAGYLLEEGRVDELDSLMRDVLNYRADHGHVEATVVSAHPITREARADVLDAIKGEYPNAKSFVLNQRVDPSVVGGLRIELANEELDLTVQAKLNTFKRLSAAREN